MAKFELIGPDGGKYEVEAPDAQSAIAALSKIAPAAKPTPNPDGTYGQPPGGFVLNPKTGQMEDMNSPNNPNLFTGRAAAVGLGAGQGLGYDFLDEAVGMGRPYETAVMRASDERAKQDYPLSYGIPKVAGAIAESVSLGKGLGKAAQWMGSPALAAFFGQAAPTVAGRAAQGAAVGAVEGAAFGAGQGENPTSRALGAAIYGGAGGVLGGAAPFAIQGVRSGFDKVVGGPVASMHSAPSAVRASQAIETAVKRSGQSADDVQRAITMAAREGQPDFAAVDALGNSGQRMLSGVARTPNDARTEIVDFLNNRQMSQGERLSGFLDTAMNSPQNPMNLPVPVGSRVGSNLGKTAKEVEDGLIAARTSAANVAFDASRAGAAPVDIRPALAVIDDRIGGMQGSGVAGDGIDGLLAKYRNRLAASPAKLPNGTLSRELSDFSRVLGVKQDISDDIGAAIRAGRGNEARELGKLKDALDGALEAASKPYRAANDEFAKASRVIDAMDKGRASASPQKRSIDVLNEYGTMTPAQQEAYRAGKVDPMIAKIDAARPGANKADMLMSGKAKAEIPAMAKNPDLYNRQVARENTMFQTRNAAIGGSKTADNMEDTGDLANFDFGVLANLFRGQFSTAAQQAIPTALNVMQGRNTATRAEIARALMSKDIKAALKPAELARISTAPKAALAELFMRSLMRLTN